MLSDNKLKKNLWKSLKRNSEIRELKKMTKAVDKISDLKKSKKVGINDQREFLEKEISK